MVDINSIVQNILYAPNYATAFAQNRVDAAKQRYDNYLANMLVQKPGE